MKKEEKAGGGGGRCELMRFEELPEYMKENEYILDHYRASFPLKDALLSLFRWHNETLDVWTHLIGFLVFVGLTLMHLSDLSVGSLDVLGDFMDWFQVCFVDMRIFFLIPCIGPVAMAILENTSKPYTNFSIASSSHIKMTYTLESMLISKDAARWPFFVFLGGSMFCLLSSTICHLFCCHSHHLNLQLLHMDYAGIAVMIVTSFFPPIYYIFQCDPHWQFIYLGGITIMGGFTVFTLLSPQLSKGPFRAYRAMLFLAMGFSGIIPAIHGTVVNWDMPHQPITLAYESAMALSYVIGTMFYVTRVPERWKPGFFDLTGHSHQIFHLFVVFGALAHYAAALVFLEWRDQVGCA